MSCGTIGSPALLLRSGITTKDNPAIGQNLTDHLILSLEFELNSDILSHHQILEDPDRAAAAEKAYRLGKNGDLVKFGGSSGVVFPKLESVFKSKEFENIKDPQIKEFLTDPGRPTTEIWFMVLPSCLTITDVTEWSSIFTTPATKGKKLHYFRRPHPKLSVPRNTYTGEQRSDYP